MTYISPNKIKPKQLALLFYVHASGYFYCDFWFTGSYTAAVYIKQNVQPSNLCLVSAIKEEGMKDTVIPSTDLLYFKWRRFQRISEGKWMEIGSKTVFRMYDLLVKP